MNNIANTATNGIIQTGYALVYFLFNIATSYYPLRRRQSLKGDMEKKPSTKEEMRITKELLTHKLTARKNKIIPLSIFVSMPALWFATNTLPLTAPTLAITILTACATLFIQETTSKIAIRKSLEILQPIPEEYPASHTDRKKPKQPRLEKSDFNMQT